MSILLNAQHFQGTGCSEQLRHRGRVRVYWTATDVSVPSTLYVAEQSDLGFSAALAEIAVPVGSGGDGFVDVEIFADQLNLAWTPSVDGDGALRLVVAGSATTAPLTFRGVPVVANPSMAPHDIAETVTWPPRGE